MDIVIAIQENFKSFKSEQYIFQGEGMNTMIYHRHNLILKKYELSLD